MRFRLIESEDIGQLSNEYDSEGNQLTKAQAEFFKNSKVRDSKGRLLVCYHGTDEEFDTFSKRHIGTNTGNLGWYGFGFYFFNNIFAARDFSSIGKVKRCYINLTNPFIWDYYNSIDDINKLSVESGVKLTPIWNINVKNRFEIKPLEDSDDEINFTKYLISKGYDGVINAIAYDNEIVAFEPNQIKSITNKNPTNSDNINEDK